MLELKTHTERKDKNIHYLCRNSFSTCLIEYSLLKMLVKIFFLGLVSSLGYCQSWVNDYDGYLYFECPEGQTVNHVVR